jgi:hypothetical protein
METVGHVASPALSAETIGWNAGASAFWVWASLEILPAWSRVQVAVGTNDSSTATVTATFSTANLTAGTKIIAAVSIAASGAQTITSVKDGCAQ